MTAAAHGGIRQRLAVEDWAGPPSWDKATDFLVVLIAISLPWSTSLVAILAVAWLVALIPRLEIAPFMRTLTRPVCLLPVAFFALAVIGMLWSDASWDACFRSAGQLARFLLIPLLIYQFERSRRGKWVFVGFLVSCVLLMVMSYLVAYAPSLALKSDAGRGVPVKNYIDQSQSFALCAVALALPILQCLRSARWGAAALLSLLVVALIANMMFIVVSRTALVCIPVMLAVFAYRHLTLRQMAWGGVTVLVVATAVWFTSPYLRTRTLHTLTEYHKYETENAASSVGLRLEFWRKSLAFFAEAPLIGNGTGSTHRLFERAATGDSGASAKVINNPHNQTLNVAVQWGALGVVILYAMWIVHLLLFRVSGPAAWIGLLVVVENVVSSLFNSHLIDFHEGWMYVLGVGVAGGLVFRNRPFGLPSETSQPPESVRVRA